MDKNFQIVNNTDATFCADERNQTSVHLRRGLTRGGWGFTVTFSPPFSFFFFFLQFGLWVPTVCSFGSSFCFVFSDSGRLDLPFGFFATIYTPSFCQLIFTEEVAYCPTRPPRSIIPSSTVSSAVAMESRSNRATWYSSE